MRLGTRGSALALAQATPVAERLGAELVTISSEGDRSAAPLAEIGGTGVFASALREALLAGEVDAVVHSLKDLPTAPYPGLALGAVPKRADARDGLCARDGLTLQTLPEGARVGTGSPRRAAQLRQARPDLEVVDIRGNVDTRLGRVGVDLDAVVLALAGLDRLGRAAAVTQELTWPTAPGQGALAIEVRTGDERSVAKLDHKPSRMTVAAERKVLGLLEAGCTAPVGAQALLDDGLLFLSASVYRTDGTERITASHALYPEDSDDPAEELAQRVSAELLELGAGALL
ncbi:MAG TPA: hydroxymethylbilane synthase [Rhodoglobus sp.]|nr:hydroxymethylbilane synthase [Rhodoglobus sp.]